jgi:hypothetical protein
MSATPKTRRGRSRPRMSLWRGDAADQVATPCPKADPNVVRHILYLEGFGRETPYLSVTEVEEQAAHFAGRSGSVWETAPERAHAQGVAVLTRKELLAWLKGTGHGRAAWPRPYEVAQARALVERWGEHLYDYCDAPEDKPALDELNGRLFSRTRR